jgi:hypothetical protein
LQQRPVLVEGLVSLKTMEDEGGKGGAWKE